MAAQHHGGHFAHESRRVIRHERREVEAAGRRLRHGDLVQPLERIIDRPEIRLHHRLALAAVAFGVSPP